MIQERRRWTVAAVAMLAAGALAACGGTDPTVSGPPTGGGTGAVQGAPAPGGGLTVDEALDSDLDGPLTVTGFLIDDGTTVRLCAAVAESYPPQCGGPNLTVEGVVVADLDGAQREGEVVWVDEASLTGQVRGETLRVSDTAR